MVTRRRKGPKVAPPRFRSRKDRRQAIRFTANARFAITAGGKLRLPKIGDVPVRWSRDLPSVPSSVTVIIDAARPLLRQLRRRARDCSLPAAEPVIGIDLGLTHFAVLSDGRKIASPGSCAGPRRDSDGRSAQCPASRTAVGTGTRPGSNSPAPARGWPTRGASSDHQLSTALIRENQAVAVEDLAVKGLARTRMAKSVHDAGWSTFVHMLDVQGPAIRCGRSTGSAGSSPPARCVRPGIKEGTELDHRDPRHPDISTCGIPITECSACELPSFIAAAGGPRS